MVLGFVVVQAGCGPELNFKKATVDKQALDVWHGGYGWGSSYSASLSLRGAEQALQISKHARTHQDQAGEKSEKQCGPTMAKQSCRYGASESEAEVFQFLDPPFCDVCEIFYRRVLLIEMDS